LRHLVVGKDYEVERLGLAVRGPFRIVLYPHWWLWELEVLDDLSGDLFIHSSNLARR
jgi:hypothetical protein